MRYPKFRRQHLIVGSGLIEAGCKPVIAAVSSDPVRSGPSAVPTRSSPSAAHLNGRFEDYWESRRWVA